MSREAKKPNYTQLTDAQLQWPHWVYQWICIQLIHIYVSLFYTLRIHGRENKPKEWKPCVVACNHISSLDPPLVSVALDYMPISYMAKLELFEKPLMRLYNWLMSSFAVNREKLEISTVKTAMKVLKHGKWSLGIFPEGTRKKDGTEDGGGAKKGVAYFAKMGKVPVLPLAMVHSVQANGRKRIDIQIGKLIPPEDDIDAFTEKIQKTIQAMADETRSKL